MAIPLAPLLLLLLSLLPQTLTLDPSNASFSLPTFAASSSKISFDDDPIGPAAFIAAAAVHLPPYTGFTYTAPLRFIAFSASFSFSVSRAGILVFSFYPSNGSASSSDIVVRYCAASAWNTASAASVQVETSPAGNATDTVRSGEVAPGMSNGERMHSWIDYDGKTVEVRVARSGDPRPGNFSVARDTADLSREAMLLHFGAWNGNSSGDRVSTLYSLEFVVRAVPYLMHSEPLDPQSILGKPLRPVPRRRSYRWRVIVGVIFAAVCGMLLVLALVFVLSLVRVKGDRRQIAPVECSEEGVECGEEKIVLVGEKTK